LRMAVGAADAFNLPIALGRVIVFVTNGLGSPALPPLSIGFVHCPALAIGAAGSVLSAAWGAALSQRLSMPALKLVFAVTI